MTTKATDTRKKPRQQVSAGNRSRRNMPSVHADAAAPVNGSTKTPTREEIEALAYLNYVTAGRPEGCHEQHWLDAEAQLTASAAHARTHWE